MAGYNSMNGAYGQQQGINWGSVAAYSAGGIAAAGLVKMGVDMAGKGVKGGASAINSKATPAIDRAKGFLGNHDFKGVAKTGYGGIKRAGKAAIGTGSTKKWAARGMTDLLKAQRSLDRNLFGGTGIKGSVAKKALNNNTGLRAASAGVGWLGAGDFRGGGWKRAAMAGLRTVGAGAAADFLNPFGFGWND